MIIIIVVAVIIITTMIILILFKIVPLLNIIILNKITVN